MNLVFPFMLLTVLEWQVEGSAALLFLYFLSFTSSCPLCVERCLFVLTICCEMLCWMFLPPHSPDVFALALKNTQKRSCSERPQHFEMLNTQCDDDDDKWLECFWPYIEQCMEFNVREFNVKYISFFRYYYYYNIYYLKPN